jgi:hypothetical protein
MIVNTQEFRRTGLYWNKHKVYTHAPEHSRDYVEFWDEEERRCLEGYTVGGVTISGRFYFYLNFCPIERVPDSILKEKNRVAANVDKIVETPAFWEIDRAWFDAKEEALNRPFGEGNHLACLKTRGCGFSFKEAADGVYNYNFIPKSKSFYLAAAKEYLTKDGILNKAIFYMNHLNRYTDWYKNRQVKNSLNEMHWRSSYLQGTEEKGFLSEIIGTVADNANKFRGKRGKKITFEEGGSFKDAKSGWAICRESVEQGGFLAGQMSLFGTGGEEGEEIEALDDMFNNPEAFNILAFENHWEEGFAATEIGVNSGMSSNLVLPKKTTNIVVPLGKSREDVCGFFVPNYLANDKYISEDGSVDIIGSIGFEFKQREQIKKGGNIKNLDKKTAERPFVPSEALKRFHESPLPRYEAQEQYKYIKRNRQIQGIIQHGRLINVGGKIKFDPSANVRPLDYYPHRNNDKLTGAVTVFEKPFSFQGKIPDRLYQIVVDPYYKDDAEDRTSLGAAYVLKRKSKASPTMGNIIAACYVARPSKLLEFYKNLESLSMYYNAKIQCEISGGGKGIIDYFRGRRMLRLLDYQPLRINNKEVQSMKNRPYFMNISVDDKRLGIEYLANWLLEPNGLNADGTEVLNIHRIYDLGLLEEITKYVDDPKKNFDRVSALIVGMFQLREVTEEEIADVRKDRKSSFFNRSFFQGGGRKPANGMSFMNEDGII